MTTKQKVLTAACGLVAAYLFTWLVPVLIATGSLVFFGHVAGDPLPPEEE